VLGLLLLVYISNFADRQIVGAVQPFIKADLRLADWQLGLLGGLAFGAFYAIVGVALARLADTKNRVNLIALSIIAWSIMTALCGAAQNFFQLLAARFGVGVGEAGSGPASNSLLTDYFPPGRRATVIGIFSLGIPLGSLVGTIGGAAIAAVWGWRMAFYLVGLPGLLLAVLVWLTIREPARGALDNRPADEATPKFGDVVRRIVSKPALLHLTAGASLASFAGYGIAQFAVSFLSRGFELTPLQAAYMFGLVGCFAAVAGTAAGGLITDRFGRKDLRWQIWIPGLGLFLAGPLYAIGFLQPSLVMLSLFVVPPIILQYLYLGPTFGLLHNMMAPRMRATAVALANMVISLVGLGLGPTVVGALSDVFGSRVFTGAGGYLDACPGGLPPTGAAPALAAACGAASFTGLKYAIVAVSLTYAWAGVHFFLAARTIRRDLAA